MEKVDYIQLTERFLKGETSEAENEILFQWFDTEEAREELYASFDEKWQCVSDSLPKIIQEKIYNRIKEDTLPVDAGKVSNSELRVKWRYALVACISAAIAIAAFYLLEQPLPQNNFVVSAGEGMKSMVELPDGTKVWLNSGSSLTYNNTYNSDHRTVHLEGEGYFDVAKDLEKAFIVEANGVEITALGTKFDVKAYKGEPFITTSLLEGKVSVRGEKKEVILSQNQEVRFNLQSTSFSEIREYDASQSSLWKDNQFYFDNESLEEIGKILERQYSVEVVFTSEAVKKYTFCGIINNTTLFNVLECIRLTSPIEYETKNNTLYFSEIKKKSNLK